MANNRRNLSRQREKQFKEFLVALAVITLAAACFVTWLLAFGE